MPICKPSHSRCLLGEIEQPEEEFLTDFYTPTGKHIRRKTRLCRTCREQQQRYKNPAVSRKGMGVGSRGTGARPVNELKPGNEPPMSDAHRQMWRRWLLGLVRKEDEP